MRLKPMLRDLFSLASICGFVPTFACVYFTSGFTSFLIGAGYIVVCSFAVKLND